MYLILKFLFFMFISKLHAFLVHKNSGIWKFETFCIHIIPLIFKPLNLKSLKIPFINVNL